MDSSRFGFELRRARRRKGLSLRALQILVHYDFTYLGQVERGEKPGSLALAVNCDDALSTEGRLAALFRDEPSAEGVPKEPTRREDVAQRPIRSGTGVAPLSPPPEKAPSEGEEADRNHDWIPEPNRQHLATLRALYHGTYSVDRLARDIAVHLAVNGQRLQCTTGNARRTLLRERADAALLAGRLSLFDRWLPVTARGCLMVACDAAVKAEDDGLAAAALGHLTFVAARENLPTASTRYLDAARRHAERSGLPSLVSWVAAVDAESLAPQEPGRGLRALDRATDALARPPTEPTPDWFDFYSPARLEGFRGGVLLAAARGEAARESLTAALDSIEPDAVKQRAVLLADLAATHLCLPDPDIAQLADEALAAANELGRTGYGAAADRLARLRGRLDAWGGSRAVRDLDDALATSAS